MVSYSDSRTLISPRPVIMDNQTAGRTSRTSDRQEGLQTYNCCDSIVRARERCARSHGLVNALTRARTRTGLAGRYER